MTSGKKKETPPPQKMRTASFWSPFRGRVFRLLWAATVVSNIGGWMYNAAAGWLMTSLDPDPLMVALVQAAASLPMFLFALPAGALADIIDKRRFILTLEALVTLASVVFAGLVSADLVTARTLLLLTILLSLAMSDWRIAPPAPGLACRLDADILIRTFASGALCQARIPRTE